MKTLRLLPLTCILAFGCDSDSDSSGDSAASESASDSAGNGDSEGDTDAGSSSGDASASAGPSTSSNETGSAESSGDTGSAMACDIEEVVNEAIEGGDVSAEDILDCGTVTPDDDPSAWPQMGTCILDAVADGQVYRAFVRREGGDGITEAFGAVAGPDGLVHQHWLSGGQTGNVLMERCSEPALVPDCEPSAMWGTCVGCFGEGNVVCSPS